MNWDDKLFVAALTIISIVTVIGNILVILAVLTTRRLQNPPNFLLVNLAVSDFFQGALSTPLRLAEVLNNSDENLIRCDIVISITILFKSASNLNLALIALDRFIAVSRPFAYANIVKNSSYKIVIAASWIFFIILSGCPVVGWRKESSESVGTICRYSTTLTEEYLIMYFCIVDVTPCVIMIITYTYIFRTSRRQISQIRAQEIAVKHAAINQACDCRRASEVSASSEQFRKDEQNLASNGATENDHDRPSSTINNHMDSDSKNEGTMPESIVNTTSTSTEAGNIEKVSNNNNNNDQNSSKIPVTPQSSNNGNISGSQQQKNNLKLPIQPEVSSTGDISYYNSCNDHNVVLRKTSSNSRNVPLSTTRSRKATRTVLAIIGFFIVLCLPITIIDGIEQWCESCADIPGPVITIALCLVKLNACVNVFVYGGYNTDYRKAYWNIWYRAKGAFLNLCARTKGTVHTVHTVSSTEQL